MWHTTRVSRRLTWQLTRNSSVPGQETGPFLITWVGLNPAREHIGLLRGRQETEQPQIANAPVPFLSPKPAAELLRIDPGTSEMIPGLLEATGRFESLFKRLNELLTKTR